MHEEHSLLCTRKRHTELLTARRALSCGHCVCSCVAPVGPRGRAAALHPHNCKAACEVSRGWRGCSSGAWVAELEKAASGLSTSDAARDSVGPVMQARAPLAPTPVWRLSCGHFDTPQSKPLGR